MRRCNLEMNEAIFLLEAASGDVRAAATLASSTTSWAAPAARAGIGSLTAATNLALANACKPSPPEDAPCSPLDGGAQWPSISQAMASDADDWALVEDSDAERDQPDEWVELDLEVRCDPLASCAALCWLPAAVGAFAHRRSGCVGLWAVG